MLTQTRFTWFEDICRQNFAGAPASAREFIEEFASEALTSPVEKLALLLYLSELAISSNPMAERICLAKSRLLKESADKAKIESDLLLPLAKWFLQCNLDNWPHWALKSAFRDTMQVAVLCLHDSENENSRYQWLSKWGFEDALIQAFLKSTDRIVQTDPPGFGNADIMQAVDDVLKSHGVESKIPRYLGEVPPYIQWIAKVQSLDKRPNIPTDIISLIAKTREWLENATFLEFHLVRRLDATRVLQPEDVATRWTTIHSEEDGPRMPSITTSSGTQPPRWVVGRIVDLGARSMHQLVGPMPYWFGTFEERTPILRSIGLTSPEQNRRTLQFHLVCDDGKEEKAHIPLTYHLGAASDLVHLSYVVAVGTIRVDLFHLTPEVQHLLSIDLALPHEILALLRKLLCEEYATAWGNDLERINTAFVQDHGGDATAGFMISEWSKAEDIVEDIGLEASARTGSTWDQYNESRISWLAMETTSAQRDLATAVTGRERPATDELLAARSGFLRARDRVRSDHREAFDRLHGDERLARLRRCLGRHEAFVHVSCSNGILSAFVAQGGTEDITDCYFYELPLTTIIDLVSRPRDSPDYFEGIRTALLFCRDDVGEFFTSLLPRGIRNLFVSLPGVIDELPLHMLPLTGESIPAFALFDSFTYCASAMLLSERVRRTSLIYTNKVSILAYEGMDGLMALGDEVESVADAWSAPYTWLGEAATPARAMECLRGSDVVHFSCHGYASERPLGSGLELYDAVRSRGFLTAADLLAIPPLQTAARVVVLSSCFGGAHNTARNVVHRFTSVDNVLLRLGVRCVVSSTRSLDGISAVAFSRAFYRSLSRGCTAAISYRYAMIAVADVIGRTDDSVLETLSSIRLVGDGAVTGPTNH